MTCPNCGAENPAEARFCLSCGTALTDEARQEVEERRAREDRGAAPPETEVLPEPTGETAAAPALEPEAPPEERPGPFLRPAGGWGSVIVGGWARALSRGSLAFVVMLVLAAVMVGLAEAGDPSGLTPVELGKVVGLVFFAFHHVGIRAEVPSLEVPAGQAPVGAVELSFTVSVSLLLATFLAVALLYWGGRAVARQVGGSAVARSLHGAKVALPYAVLSFGLSFLVSFTETLPPGQLLPSGGTLTFGPEPLGALLWPLFLGLLFGGLGGLASAGRWMEAEARTVRARGIVRGGLVMTLYAVIFAFVGYLIVVALNPDLPAFVPFSPAYFRDVTAGGLDGILLLAVTVLVIPNIAVWVLVPAMGGSLGFFIAGASFQLLSYARFPSGVGQGAPPTPLFGGPVPPLPRFDTAPLPYFLFLLVPLVATLLGGWWAARRAGARTRGEGAATGAAAGVVYAAAVTGLIVISSIGASFSGGLGGFVQTGRGHVGPPLLLGALLALVWGMAGGALGGTFAGRRGARRPAGVDVGFVPPPGEGMPAEAPAEEAPAEEAPAEEAPAEEAPAEEQPEAPPEEPPRRRLFGRRKEEPPAEEPGPPEEEPPPSPS